MLTVWPAMQPQTLNAQLGQVNQMNQVNQVCPVSVTLATNSKSPGLMSPGPQVSQVGACKYEMAVYLWDIYVIQGFL